MNQKYAALIYLFLISLILGSLYLLHQRMLKGRMLFLQGEPIGVIAVDDQDRIWVRTAHGVSLITETGETSYALKGEYLSWPNDFQVIRIDTNNHVWVITDTGLPYGTGPVAGSHSRSSVLYSFDGSYWTLEGKCCLPGNRAEVKMSSDGKVFYDEQGRQWLLKKSRVKVVEGQDSFDYTPFLRVGVNSFHNWQGIISDKQGNIWIGTDSGLIRFSPNFRPPFFPLNYLYVFLSTGGYWFLGLILMGLFAATLFDALSEVSLGIGLGLGLFIIFGSFFEYPVVVASNIIISNLVTINPGVFAVLGGITGGLIGRRFVRVSEKKNGRARSATIKGVIIGSMVGIFQFLPLLLITLNPQ